ncbi:MAG TPA: HEAT repeat domain-containing protein [Tepidisphaeraceae bacterium]
MDRGRRFRYIFRPHMRKNRLVVAAAFAAAVLSSVVLRPVYGADEDFGVGEGGDIPKLKPASDAGERALLKMKPAPGLKVDLWAAEPMLANPVALSFDEHGRCYVVETWRFEHGVIDLRRHLDWLDDDLASRTVEDRLKLVKRKMGPNARKFAQTPDVIRVLEDVAGTGKADKSTVFGEFKDMADGVAAGILAHKGNIYFTDIPNLWLLKDTTGSGPADVKKVLSYGYGVRFNFLGHDLHGPRFGPDGKIYFSIGDRGANIEQSVDGRHVENTESGSIFRCNPDGSGLEIYATGLRNPQSLAFDDYGNLFTGDNNPDYGDPARWVYIVEGGDSGWRVGYQWDHNPVGGGPWMWEKLWITQDKSNAMYLIPPVADKGAGPSGVAYYPGTGLSHAYDHHFFECDFRGGFTGSGVHTFTMEPDGAGFKIANEKEFIWDTLATDIAFAPSGGAYITDWVQGWHVSGVGRIYKITDPVAMKDPIVEQVKNLLAEGFEKRSPEELIKLLAHRDQRIRQEAQFELADRGDLVVPLLTRAAQKNDSQLARIHAIWALGQIGTKSSTALDPIVPLLADSDAEVRAQAARALGDHHDAKAYDGFLKLLNDSKLRDRYFAAMGLAKLGRKAALPAILNMLRENADKDVYVRHAGVTALVALDDWATIQSAAKDESRSVRLAALLAMRRMARPEIAAFLHDRDPQLVLEAARAINDLPITAALPQLASLIDDVKLADFVMIRVVNANFRLGTPQGAAALAKFAGNPAAPERWRVEALKDLESWAIPGARDRVTNLVRPLADRDPKVARDAAGPAVAAILNGAPDKVRVAALALVQKLGVNDPGVLMRLLADNKLSTDVRIGALKAMAAGQNDPKLPEAIALAMKSPLDRLRAAGIGAMAKLPDAASRIEPLLNKGTIREQQAAYAALGDAPGKAADDALAKALDQLLAKQIKPELQLDVLDAAAKRPAPEIQQRIQKVEDHWDVAADPLSPFRIALQGGDAEAGDKIFHERSDASCLRCHTIHGTGGIVGPVLDGIGAKQNREYLLESIVYPNAKIAPGFESVILRLKDGKAVTGIVKKETDSQLELIDADGKQIEVNKSEIQSRERGQSAMPEGFGRILSKRDLRDLVEYLASLKK